jgi:hypothetical protein
MKSVPSKYRTTIGCGINKRIPGFCTDPFTPKNYSNKYHPACGAYLNTIDSQKAVKEKQRYKPRKVHKPKINSQQGIDNYFRQY